MGQPAQKPGGTRFKVKRILRKGSHFVCGMCGSQHTAGKTAVACLEKCVSQYLNQSPVTATSRNGQSIYVCKFCKREHQQEASAAACAKACQSKLQKTAAKEQTIARKKLSGVTLAQPPEPENPTLGEPDSQRQAQQVASASMGAGSQTASPGTQQMHVGRAPAPQANRQNPPRRNPAILASEPAIDALAKASSAAASDEDPTIESTATAKSAESDNGQEPSVSGTASAPKPKRKKVPDNKKFRRDGARYICRDCKEKFFTRDEVIACYDSHDDE